MKPLLIISERVFKTPCTGYANCNVSYSHVSWACVDPPSRKGTRARTCYYVSAWLSRGSVHSVYASAHSEGVRNGQTLVCPMEQSVASDVRKAVRMLCLLCVACLRSVLKTRPRAPFGLKSLNLSTTPLVFFPSLCVPSCRCMILPALS